MVKRDSKGKEFWNVGRIFGWMRNLRYRERRKLSDHRATSLAVKLTLSGSLTPHRAIPSVARGK